MVKWHWLQQQTRRGDSRLAFFFFLWYWEIDWSNRPDPSPAGCPSHYPPTEPLFPHNSKLLDNLNLLAKLYGCSIKNRRPQVKRLDITPTELEMKNNNNKKSLTHSWSTILSGARRGLCLQILGNCVLLRISATSAFLFSSSPSFSPEARWLHTKQKLVWCNDMLIDIHPCNVRLHRSNFKCIQDLLIAHALQIILFSFSGYFQAQASQINSLNQNVPFC
jgi:hypothetical protein